MTNEGETDVPYSWLQHVAFGADFIGPECTVAVPCTDVLVDPHQTTPNARFEPGSEHAWPVATSREGEDVDLRSPPPKDERVHDLLALTGLDGGHYTVTNPDLDLAARVTFPRDLYEYVWYWGAFGGFEEAPFFGRNYNLGLEPCTSVPNAGLDSAIEAGTANTLQSGETVTAELAVETGPVER
jgi:galactose mutarotase-like enzyme